MMKLKNKTILITGASKGIGLELSKQLDSEGVNLILVGRNFSEKPFVDKHSYIEADLLTAKGISTVKNSIKNKSIDVLCNVAGIGVYKSLEELTTKELEESIRVNTIAPFELIKLTYEKLKASEIGLVINIGSGEGTMPFKNRSVYCASKYALRGLSLSLSEEYLDTKPHICLITLGSTMTTFGGKSIEEQQKKIADGNAIFPVEFVAKELVKIIKADKYEPEIVLYPGDMGFGKWEKPK